MLVWLIVWIFISTAFTVAQIATPESNFQSIKSHDSRISRLEDKTEHIAEVMTSIKYLEEKIDDVSSTQKLVLLGVSGALLLNLLNVFTRRHQDLLHMMRKKQDKPLGK